MKKVSLLLWTFPWIVILYLNVSTWLNAATIRVPDDYATIQEAIHMAVDGDSILVAPGTYPISTHIYNDSVNNLCLIGSKNIDNSNASIVDAVVNPGTYVGIWFKGVRGCVISGFEVKNAHSGISLHDCFDCLVTNNYLHDNDQATSFHGNGLEIFNCDGVDVTYNIFDRNEFHAIQVAYGNQNINIINNTLLRTYTYDGISLDGPYCHNLTIKNNIIAYSRQEGIEVKGTNNNFIHDYNCYWQNGRGPISPSHTIGSNSFIRDPHIVNIEGGCYFLESISPCLDSGEEGIFMGALGLQNNPPIADAGPDQIVECTSTCFTEVTMDGSGSYDPDSDILTYHWTWDTHEVFGPSPAISLPLGTTTIVCVVHDGQAASQPDSVNITIVDTTPPEISVNIQPEQLWPPNHKMVEVTASVMVQDLCDPAPVFTLLSIVSNEPEEGPGKKHTPDILEYEPGTNDVTFQLRAERLGYGTGRVYTITYQTADASGNTAVGYDSVVVHHQIQKGRNMPPDIFQELPYASNSIQNHPNPFNPATTIFYSLSEKGNVRLSIYNVLGEEIRSLWNGQKQAGHHTITWDGLDNKGRTVAGGIYLCRIETSAYQKTIRMLMLK